MAVCAAVLRLPYIVAVAVVLVARPSSSQSPPEDVPPDVSDQADPLTGSDDDPYRPRFLGFPVVGYTPDTSVAFAGLGMVRFRTRSCSPTAPQSSVSVAASYTLRNQWLASVDPAIVLDDDRLRLEGGLLLQDWGTDFFGIGDESRISDLEEYVPRRVRAEAEVQHAVGDPRLYVGALYRVAWVDIREVESGGMLDTTGVPGRRGGVTSGVGLTLTWDNRDSKFFPTRGAYARGRVGGNPSWLGSDHEYAVGTLDARAYFDLGRRAEHILAGRLYTELNSGDVPFYELSELGGMSLMRGMSQGRYRDHNLVAGQIEYRTPFVWRFGFVAFSGIGDVFRRFDDFDIDDPKWTAGLGVRVRIDDESRINVRLDYGISVEERDGFYLSIMEAF